MRLLRVLSARLRPALCGRVGSCFVPSKGNSLECRSILHNDNHFFPRRFSGPEITPISPRFIDSGWWEKAAQTSAFPGKAATTSPVVTRGSDCEGRNDALSSTGLNCENVGREQVP